MSRRWITVVASGAVASALAVLGPGVAAAGPAPGILDGDPCAAEGAVRVEPTSQSWNSTGVSAEAFGPATLTLNETKTLTNTVRLNAGVDLKVVNASVGYDVARAQAVTIQGSFAAPADPPGAKWVLTANVRVQHRLVYTCNGGRYARVGYIAQNLDRVEFQHYAIPATPHVPG